MTCSMANLLLSVNWASLDAQYSIRHTDPRAGSQYPVVCGSRIDALRAARDDV